MPLMFRTLWRTDLSVIRSHTFSDFCFPLNVEASPQEDGVRLLQAA